MPRWADAHRTGKMAEGGKNTIGIGKIKTGEAQTLFAKPIDGYPGMNMPGENIFSAGMLINTAIAAVVLKTKTPDFKASFMNILCGVAEYHFLLRMS